MTTTDCPPLADRITKSLLGYGVIAGPLYIVAVAAQAATRDGFDPTRQAASELTQGPWGWIQVVTFLVTGAMTVAAAVGVGRALGPTRRGRWAAILLGGYGVGLMAAGVFSHGIAHFAVAGLGFAGLVGACFVIGGWASRAVGLFFAASFAVLASGRGGSAAVLTFTAAVVLAWLWLAVVSVRLYRRVG
jgi:hypothetical membrane protein